MKKNRRGIISLAFLLLTVQGYSQVEEQHPENSGTQAASTDTIKDITTVVASYINKAGAQAELYYGVEHTGYSPKIEGIAYYAGADWQKGTIIYNGTLYTGISMKYDMVADELVVLHPNNYFGLAIVSDRVSAFAIGNNSFVYMPQNNRYALKPGFYETLVSGELTLLAKRTKKIDEKIFNNEVQKKFVEDFEFYIIKDGAAHHITGESYVMDLLGDKARKVRGYLREKEISFRTSKELALVEIAVYYNQLSQ
jgi:hypothetical protein